ncbi:MAG: threonylcarbamoyl-AMP synthase [Ruminococcaceae bacterium]|nr:threonylcarbamoyl-AMP synthase [Oscillospiraceae bacterium]
MNNTKIYTIASADEGSAQLAEAAEILRRGGLVVFPTETVYGLGGNATDSEAAQKIYAAKGRPSDNPLIIHIAYPEDAADYAEISPLYLRLAEAFMPGPLTVILPKKDTIPHSVTGGLDSVAVRCPAHPIAHALIAAAGIPIAAPSANLSGKPSPTCAAHVIEDLSGRVDVIIDGGNCDIGLESTILKIDGDHPVLLRPGGITLEQLEAVCGPVEVAAAVIGQLAPGERPLSPGMMYRHYAPSTPLTLVRGERGAVTAYLAARQAEGCGILCYAEDAELLSPERCIILGHRDSPEEQAHHLFTALRDADALNAPHLYAPMPEESGMGLALCNRMLRAAAHTVIEL